MIFRERRVGSAAGMGCVCVQGPFPPLFVAGAGDWQISRLVDWRIGRLAD